MSSTATTTQAASQLVCIKRPEPGLSTVFEDMYLNERLVDVTLSCCDGQIQAHKLVLAACSSYFSNLFDKLANPFHYPVIIIKDMRIKDLKLIVDFMYRGQLTITQERLTTLVKSAENLQINGLSNVDGTGVQVSNVDGFNSNGSRNNNQRSKRSKKTSSSLNLNQHQATFGRPYNPTTGCRHDELDSPQPDKLLEQSMLTGELIDDPNHQFSYATNNDPTSTRNLNNQQLHTPSPSSINVHHHLSSSNIDQTSQQHQFSNQLQVLSHSLSANRSSSAHATVNNNQTNSFQTVSQQSRGRVHPCNICWKTFREKANLKRHLQVHSINRRKYECPDCNKTFSWKDNYIRHTKTSHHLNNVRLQS